MRSAGRSTASTATGSLSANSAAPTWSTGRRILTPFSAAFARRSFAVPRKSSSTSDLPTSCPCALRNVYAIPPPTMSVEAFFMRLSRTAIFEETFAPPMIAVIGFSGFVTIGWMYLTSFSIKNPPTDGTGMNFAIEAVEAWSRCAVPNASLTKMSP